MFTLNSESFINMIHFNIRFGGRQISATEDDGSVKYALIRDDEADNERLEQFGAELEKDDN